MAPAPNDSSSKMVEQIVAGMRDAFPPQYPSQSPVRETSSRMSENNGQSGALHVEVESIKGQFHDFREETNFRFQGISNDIRGLTKQLGEFMASQGSRGGENLKSIAGFIIAGVTVTLTILGAFGNLAKANLDTNIAFTNEKIGVTNTTVDKLAGTVRDLASTVVPRYEADYRFANIEKRLDHKTNDDVFAKAADMRDDQIRELRETTSRIDSRISELQSQSVNKGELQGLNERFSTLSNRLSNFAEKFTAVPKDPRLQ